MSNIYIQEPPTNGKVLLTTTAGEIEVELWSKEAPLACRNFVQLCLEGYYDGTVFHRVIPGFIAQGGDPLGTGEGGESIYGKPFKDEFHSRLRFVRRGLVACANSGPNDNGSQFFFTLGQCKELHNKHTIFGKVAGDTLYNLPRFEEGEIDKDDRPVYPQKVTKTEVLLNPFTDIVPREAIANEIPKEERKKKKKKGVKNFSLLSFGGEAEEEEALVISATREMGGAGGTEPSLLNPAEVDVIPPAEREGAKERIRAKLLKLTAPEANDSSSSSKFKSKDKKGTENLPDRAPDIPVDDTKNTDKSVAGCSSSNSSSKQRDVDKDSKIGEAPSSHHRKHHNDSHHSHKKDKKRRNRSEERDDKRKEKKRRGSKEEETVNGEGRNKRRESKEEERGDDKDEKAGKDEENIRKRKDKDGSERKRDERDDTTEDRKSSKRRRSSADADKNEIESDEMKKRNEKDSEEKIINTLDEKRRRTSEDGDANNPMAAKAEEKSKVKKDAVEAAAPEDDAELEKAKKLSEMRAEIRQLKRELTGKDGKKKSQDEEDQENDKDIKQSEEPPSALLEYKQQKEKYLDKKRTIPKNGKKREDVTLALMEKFNNKVKSALTVPEKDYDGKEAADDEDNDDDWLRHRLVYDTETPVLARDASTKDDTWYPLDDPRHPLNRARREDASKGKGGSKHDRK